MSELSGKWRNGVSEIEIVGPADAKHQVIGMDIYIAHGIKGGLLPGDHLVTRESLRVEGFEPVSDLDHWLSQASSVLGYPPDQELEGELFAQWTSHLSDIDDVRLRVVAALKRVLKVTDDFKANAKFLPGSKGQEVRADAADYIQSVIEEELLGEQ